MPEPQPLGDILKERCAKARAHEAKLRIHGATTESSSQDRQTRAADPHSGAEKSGIRPLKPSTDMSKPLSERLFDLFGGGDSPTLRRALYIRCQLTCQTFGEPAALLLREVVQAALQARNPGNYFAFSIVRRFRENGFVQEV